MKISKDIFWITTLKNRIKSPHDNNKVSKETSKYEQCKYQQEKSNLLFISFSFLTSQKGYNFEKVETLGTPKEKAKFYSGFNKTISDMTIEGWTSLQNKSRKNGGSEDINYGQMRFCPNDPEKILNLSNDSKIKSISFCSRKYRLLGVKGRKCSSVFYVIGFDLKHDAYNH